MNARKKRVRITLGCFESFFPTISPSPYDPLEGFPILRPRCSHFSLVFLSTLRVEKSYDRQRIVDEVTQVKRLGVPLVRLLEQLPSIIPLLVRPANPFITHETTLMYGDGGCCISWL